MSPKPTLYFGYGSNLWQQQMRQRCPTSQYLGIARLKGYKWVIYERGYANIVQIPAPASEAGLASRDGDADMAGDKHHHHHDYSHEVWGLVYSLQPEDEARLDVNEGVPRAYQKETIQCEFWSVGTSASGARDKVQRDDMLVYIDRTWTRAGKSREEYVYRMNMGIRDAVREGVPEEYVDQVMRKWIPEGEDKEVRSLAARQAAGFEDER